MRILVTGGAGYIGSHACKVLARTGFEPIVFDNLSRGNRWAVKWGPLELGDVANSVRLWTVLEQYRPAALMHFAAYAYVGESVEQPLLYYRNNVAGSTALFRAIIETRTIPKKSKVARKQTASRPVEAKRKRQKAKTVHKRSGAKKSASRRPSGTTPPSPPVQTETTIVDVVEEPIPLV
jgi:GDP-D-mannose dehydratase